MRRVSRLRWLVRRMSPAPTRGGRGLHRLGQGRLVSGQQLGGQVGRARQAPAVLRWLGGCGGAVGRRACAKKVSKQASKRSTSSALLARVTQRASFRSVPVGVADLGGGAVGVDGLGRRDADFVRAQGAQKALERVLHRLRHGRLVQGARPQKLGDPRLDGDDVDFELQEHVQRLADQVRVERRGVQQDQGARPVDGLGDRWQLAQIECSQRLDEAHQFALQAGLDARHADGDDPLLQSLIGQGDVQVQAPALQRVAEVAHVVRGQEHHRRRSWP